MNVEIIEKVMRCRAIVESEANEGTFYKVDLFAGQWKCTCPDFIQRRADAGEDCKHIEAVKEDIA